MLLFSAPVTQAEGAEAPAAEGAAPAPAEGEQQQATAGL